MIPKKYFGCLSYIILILCISEVYCDEKSSLTFIIDDTASMQPVIDEVKNGVNKIFDAVTSSNHSQIENYVLVTFNDFDQFNQDLNPVKLRTSTKDKQVFKDELSVITVDGGWDCPEYSMSGIMEGIEISLPKSTIYVFTDASAKDGSKYEQVKNLAVKKQSQVTIIRTNNNYCRWDKNVGNDIYSNLADATSGMFFIMEEYDIKQIINDIVTNIRGRRTEITRKKFLIGYGNTFTFSIDDKHKEVTITVTGENPASTIIGPNGSAVETNMLVHTANVLITEIVNTIQGYYTATVGSSSETRAVVTARTQVMFIHGFSTFKQLTIDGTSTNPQPDVKSYIYIKITDGDIKLQTVKITNNESGKELEEIPLYVLNENDKLYITNPVQLPSTLFKLTISGIDPDTYKVITRTGPPVEPEPREPEVTIAEGDKVNVDYNASITLTCNVSAYQTGVRVVWTRDGTVLNSKTTETAPNEYVSQLTLSNVKYLKSYYCQAISTDKRINTVSKKIDVSPWFRFISAPKATTPVKYGEEITLRCDVWSSYPTKIVWRTPDTLKSSDYSISADSKNLKIKSMNYSNRGWYTCKTTILGIVPYKSTIVSTNVIISDLARPAISISQPTTILPGARIHIWCKIIAGVPRPTINWRFMRKGDQEFKKIGTSAEEIIIDSATAAHAGQYQCIARNHEDQATESTDVIVQKALKVSIDEGKSVTVAYGSTNVFNCRVVAYPLPKIVWKDGNGHIKLDSKKNVSNYEQVSQLTIHNTKGSDTYFCKAENDLETAETSVQVSVLPLITLIADHSATISVKYKDSATIICNAKSSYPLTIKWYYQKNKHSKIIEIHTSDKYVISTDKRTLSIQSTDLELVGKYTCEASVDDEDVKKSLATEVEINNLKAPEITVSDRHINVMNGQKMTAFCKTTGIPKPEVTWEFKSKNSNTFTSIPVKGEDIVNPLMVYEWAGSYKCNATNQVGMQTRFIDVVVYGKPEITNINSVYFGVTGDKVLKIPCEVSGVPEPTITWSHQDEQVVSDNKVWVVKNAVFIKNPTEKDNSNFTCEARNKYGHAERTFLAIVSDFIESYDGIAGKNLQFRIGESVVIQCLLPNSDPKSIRWFVDLPPERCHPSKASITKNENGEKTDVFGSSYTIQNATTSNDANYTCRWIAEHGSESQNYLVTFGYEPSFIVPLPQTIDWRGNHEELLKCEVNAKPAVKVEWSYNGKLLDGQNSPELAIFGWGVYTCRVSNVHGAVQHTYNVTSDGCLIDRTDEKIQNTPLLINDELSVWPKISNSIQFYSRNYIITLKCSTEDNPTNSFQTHPNAKKIYAKCYNEDKFIVDGNMYKFNELKCTNNVMSSVVHTKQPCMQNGEIVEIGFKLKSAFLGVYDACYTEVEQKLLYTKVVMTDTNLNNIIRVSNSGIVKCEYSDRWLVSPEDVAFGPAQAATMSHKYNSVPVYEPCKDSSRLSWSDIETKLKDILLSVYTMTVWTGASHYSAGTPRYLWKVVKVDNLFETLVYVNVPYPNSSDVLCLNTGLNIVEDITNAKDIYSCSMEDFLNTFDINASEFS